MPGSLLAGLNQPHLYIARKKPPPGSIVNPQHPLARGLICALPISEARAPYLKNQAYGTSGVPSGSSYADFSVASGIWGAGAGDTFGGPWVGFGDSSPGGTPVGLVGDSGPFYRVQSHTIAAWVRTPTTTGNNISYLIVQRMQDVQVGGYEWGVRNVANAIVDFGFAYYGGGVNGWYDDTTNLTLGAWYLLTGVWVPGTVSFYINGRLSTSVSTSSNAINHITGDAFGVGMQPNTFNHNFPGRYAAFWMWNRPLSAAEVYYHYTRPFEMFQASPRDLWSIVPPAGGTTFTISMSGSVTPAGTLVRQTQKTLVGLVTPAGTLTKQDQRSAFTGSVTPAGTLTKQDQKTLTGSVTPTGTSSYLKVILRSFTGSVTPAGTLGKQVLKTLTGSITPAGTLGRVTLKTLVGSITPAGTLVKTFLRTFTGSNTPAGTLARQIRKTLVGSVSPTATMTPTYIPGGQHITVTGSVTPTGVLGSRMVMKGFSAGVTPAGALGKQFRKTLVGLVTAIGTLITNFLAGTGSTTGNYHASNSPVANYRASNEEG